MSEAGKVLQTLAMLGSRAPWEPNCVPGETRTDGPGLVHDWKLITEDGPGDVYRCRRCGVEDVD